MYLFKLVKYTFIYAFFGWLFSENICMSCIAYKYIRFNKLLMLPTPFPIGLPSFRVCIRDFTKMHCIPSSCISLPLFNVWSFRVKVPFRLFSSSAWTDFLFFLTFWTKNFLLGERFGLPSHIIASHRCIFKTTYYCAGALEREKVKFVVVVVQCWRRECNKCAILKRFFTLRQSFLSFHFSH